MGSQDMVCRVAILNIGLEDTLTHLAGRGVCGLASRRRWLSSRAASSRAKARQARASGLSNGNLANTVVELRGLNPVSSWESTLVTVR